MVTINDKKVDITYPCEWTYKVIGKDSLILEQIIQTTLHNRTFNIKPSNTSKTGKFVSLNVNVLLFNDEERLFYYETFQKNKEILYLL